MSGYRYVGTELELFARALRWKAYWASLCRRHIHGHVLEVGAGIGKSTELVISAPHRSWTCLEPDAELVRTLQANLGANAQLRHCTVVHGTLESMAAEASFDTLLYVDVLEHIEADAEEVERAARVLAPGGCLIVVAPAHQFLFTPFDAAVGHHRRYRKADLARLTPRGLRLRVGWYLDSVGMLAALGNRLLLRQEMPSERQILTWDRLMVPCSRLLDPVLGHRLGKSILAVWEKV
jgi:SAM-dependent methyltransferase